MPPPDLRQPCCWWLAWQFLWMVGRIHDHVALPAFFMTAAAAADGGCHQVLGSGRSSDQTEASDSGETPRSEAVGGATPKLCAVVLPDLSVARSSESLSDIVHTIPPALTRKPSASSQPTFTTKHGHRHLTPVPERAAPRQH